MNMEKSNYISISNEDCLIGASGIADNNVDLIICDPPFGIGEASFNKHYKRDVSKVIRGYKEAPSDYAEWTYLWLEQAKRILKENGSLYVIMGHSNLRHLLNAAADLDLFEINHLIWKYNFGVFTKKKFVTSHYHLLYYAKSSKSKTKFNTNCRFGSQEKDAAGGSLLFQDMEDVFNIKKDYSPGKIKNQNKLPDSLVEKLILYSSDPGDLVADFFMGNFTTAYVALNLGRRVAGFEVNKDAFDYHSPLLKEVKFGSRLNELRKFENVVPENQGKLVSPEEASSIYKDYLSLLSEKKTKSESKEFLQNKYKRGRFSIHNIIQEKERQK